MPGDVTNDRAVNRADFLKTLCVASGTILLGKGINALKAAPNEPLLSIATWSKNFQAVQISAFEWRLGGSCEALVDGISALAHQSSLPLQACGNQVEAVVDGTKIRIQLKPTLPFQDPTEPYAV